MIKWKKSRTLWSKTEELRQCVLSLFLGIILTCLFLNIFNYLLDGMLRSNTSADYDDLARIYNLQLKGKGNDEELRGYIKNMVLYGKFTANDWRDSSFDNRWRWLSYIIPVILTPELPKTKILDGLLQRCEDLPPKLRGDDCFRKYQPQNQGESEERSQRFREEAENQISQPLGAVLDGMRSKLDYKLRRYLNGGIQAVTLIATFMGVSLISFRFLFGWRDRDKLEKILDGATKDFSIQEGDKKDSNIHEYLISEGETYTKSNRKSAILDIIFEVYKTYQLHNNIEEIEQNSVEEARRKLEVDIAQLREENESRYGIIRYIIWAVPSLGFIGTVVGIGDALGIAHQVVAKSGLQQEGAVQEVTAQLAYAFDTTFVALVASLILMFLIHGATRYEEKTVSHAYKRINTGILNLLSAKPDESEKDWVEELMKRVKRPLSDQQLKDPKVDSALDQLSQALSAYKPSQASSENEEKK